MDPLRHSLDLLRYIERNYKIDNALNDFVKGEWVPTSTASFLLQVKQLTLALKQLGLKKGERVGILALPGSRWTIADFAIMCAGGATVPLFANISEENFVFECSQTDIRILFVGGEAQWEMFERNKGMFQTVIAIDESIDWPGSMPYDKALKIGEEILAKDEKAFDTLSGQMNAEDVGAVIYTSGSTGIPKGVELTQTNLVSTLHDDRIKWTAGEDRYLSILPLAHVFGHLINSFALVCGINIYYFNDYKNLGEACRSVQPTVLVIVPRIVEKLYGKFLSSAEESSFLKRTIGVWAIKKATVEKKLNKSSLSYKLADKLVYQKLRSALGGHLRFVVAGGAATSPELLYFFDNIGIPILQGWGMTEACAVTCNSLTSNVFGTVGTVFPGQEISISPSGEVLTRGSLVMKGYFSNPEATAAAIDKQGWLHTGDRGEIDSKGNLILKGRIKELFKTSTGEYVAPVPIEQALCSNFPLIDMAMVVAEGRKFASALLFVNPEQIPKWKQKMHQESLTDAEFLSSWSVRKALEEHIEKVNKRLNHWEQIHDFRLISEPLSIEKGELTPSMKIRREAVAQKYNQLIEEIYHHTEIQ